MVDYKVQRDSYKSFTKGIFTLSTQVEQGHGPNSLPSQPTFINNRHAYSTMVN